MFRPPSVLLVMAAMLVATPYPLLAQDDDAKKGKNLSGKDLEQRDFRNQNLDYADFTDAKLFLANFTDVSAKGAIFKDADLTSASLDGADLSGADFRGATLDRASFQRAKLQKANFDGTDLSKTSLRAADLRGANLKNIKGLLDLTAADLRGADLRGANLLGAKDYTGSSAKFAGAKYDKATRWHKGFDVENSGAVLAAANAPDEPAPRPKTNRVEPEDDPPAPKKTPADQKETPRPKGAPPEKEVKAQLEKHMWGPPLQGGTKHTYDYKVFKYGEPRIGDVRDRLPASRKDVTVYPVRVEVEITRTFTDGTSRKDTKKQTYVFFKDEFGEWTFTFKSND